MSAAMVRELNNHDDLNSNLTRLDQTTHRSKQALEVVEEEEEEAEAGGRKKQKDETTGGRGGVVRVVGGACLLTSGEKAKQMSEDW